MRSCFCRLKIKDSYQTILKSATVITVNCSYRENGKLGGCSNRNWDRRGFANSHLLSCLLSKALTFQEVTLPYCTHSCWSQERGDGDGGVTRTSNVRRWHLLCVCVWERVCVCVRVKQRRPGPSTSTPLSSSFQIIKSLFSLSWRMQ